MKTKALIGFVTIVIIGLIILCIRSCGDCSCCDTCTCKDTCQCNINKPCNSACTCNGSTAVDSTKMPLNISVYLDLSDRLMRELATEQADRDTAIIMYLAQKVKEQAVKHRIVGSKDHLKVFFYPTPKDSKVNIYAQNLDFDLAQIKDPKEKKERLLNFEQDFRESLTHIYNKAKEEHNWVGSDIWGFFKKSVDNYCIRTGNRNILVILTDGYIYHQDNKQTNGNASTFILPETLSNPNASLMVARSGLDNLAVLILEVNPIDPKQESEMERILLDWLHAMGINKAYVGSTDVPSNTRSIIDNFFGF